MAVVQLMTVERLTGVQGSQLARWRFRTAAVAAGGVIVAAHRGVPGWLRILALIGAGVAGHVAYEEYQQERR